MKIGILNSDTVKIDGAAEFGQYPEMFSKVFWAVEPKIQFKTYEVQFGDYPEDINECDAYLITCLLYTSPSPRDQRGARMPSSA